MELKQQVLQLLEENRGSSVNGSQMASRLYVTRSAVWKAVKALQKDGYRITAVTNRGYCLLTENDILTEQSIRPYLRGSARDFELMVHPTLPSTNTLAKSMASEGSPEGTVIIAHEQTEGRGRMGRDFYSPKATGIYFSLILRPRITLEDSLLITTSAAVAVCKAIEKVSGKSPQIKWINDIFLDGKKICGILTEASLDFESGCLDYAVLGIGINVSTDGFPDSIQDIAGAVFRQKPENTPISSVLCAEVLNQIAECMSSLTDRSYMKDYRERSFLIGKEIDVIRGNQRFHAKAIDIDEKAGLIVEYPDHTREVLNSGEVSVRPH